MNPTQRKKDCCSTLLAQTLTEVLATTTPIGVATISLTVISTGRIVLAKTLVPATMDRVNTILNIRRSVALLTMESITIVVMAKILAPATPDITTITTTTPTPPSATHTQVIIVIPVVANT